MSKLGKAVRHALGRWVVESTECTGCVTRWEGEDFIISNCPEHLGQHQFFCWIVEAYGAPLPRDEKE